MLLLGADDADDQHGRDGRHVGRHHLEGRNAGDPHHGGGGVADHRTGAAGIGGGDDGGEVADVYLGPEQLMGHGAADQCGGDVVEEGRHDEHQQQQREAAFPVVRQVLGQDHRDMAFLEVAREDGEAHQQAQQVRDHHPLVAQMTDEAGEAGAALEAGENDLVGGDHHRPTGGHRQRVAVKQRDAEQGEAEQDEIHRDAGDLRAGGRQRG